MKKPINTVAFAAITATVLSLSLAGSAFADSRVAAQPTMLAANTTMDKAEEAVSDTWITSKVKSTFIADDSLSGLDIKVETNKGVVALSGVVASDAERDLAVAKAKQIKGVTAVSADGLKAAD
ncbi:BON domain-containing protein [Pseudomonas sp. UBA2684]|uniref:BON domain-containing protein n=1 Tax=Pseudomonas sp. UBA2684 TaxID=1947311 RepID=UPI000E9FE839|nr:BON domain-containing protein [Pseudomonas sp. UBA2684]HBX56569.1 phospholipid-binding protein [Pseudomonas sp.]|tara:strand:+ start:47 stop:415 length:369 start_codon:yes stop_codon:yes gene_type:complete